MSGDNKSGKGAQEVLGREVQLAREHSEQAKQISDLISGYRSKGESALKGLSKQIQVLNKERHSHEESLKEFEKKHAGELTRAAQFKNEYTLKKKKRVSIASGIDIKSLINLQLEDRKSQVHQIFKWVLSIIYKEPIGKYYWDNFKTQAFKEDKGVDFKERMGKLSATDLKEDERAVTQKLVSHKDEYLNNKQITGANEAVKNIIEIAELLLEGAEIAKKTKDLGAEDDKVRSQKAKKDQGLQKAESKCVAVQDRINLTKKYLQVLADVEKTMSSKEKRYAFAGKEGNKIVGELKNLKANADSKSSYLDSAPKGQQGCLLF